MDHIQLLFKPSTYLQWTGLDAQRTSIQMSEKDLVSFSNEIMCYAINKIGAIQRFI